MLAPMKRASLWIVAAASLLVAVGVFVQVYLITAYFSGAGEGALDAHEVLGFAVIHLLELLVFLAAFGAFWRAWTWFGLSFLLFALGTVQLFLAPPDEDPASGWVHGLHGLLAIVVLVVAAVIQHHDMRLLRRRALPPAP